ncbi:MAG: imidazole glycerol phosphate synthase subunit HisH [Deltaproteobacteria bacterium]|nr:imidazole glycerol phosphate synthase subunit HisH [Deltaproteobacteria bacterium]
MTIAVIDYEMGNLRSVQKALERVGADAVITRDPDVIMGAAAAVLPGVGAFGACMESLRRHGLVEPVKIFAASGRPFLGICVGMQILFEESEEFGPVRGLGILPGRIVRFTPDPDGKRKVPQMGWNALRIVKRAPHLAGVKDGAQVYFVHSYYPEPADPELVATTTDYGCTFASSVWQDNVFATQFHPEKSQAVGLRVLANFAEIAGETGAAAAAR